MECVEIREFWKIPGLSDAVDCSNVNSQFSDLLDEVVKTVFFLKINLVFSPKWKFLLRSGLIVLEIWTPVVYEDTSVKSQAPLRNQVTGRRGRFCYLQYAFSEISRNAICAFDGIVIDDVVI